MNRRSFLTAGMVGVPALIARAHIAEERVGLSGGPDGALNSYRPYYHVLGPDPVDGAQRLTKALSDDVFERARAELKGRSYRLTSGQRLGDIDITNQWHIMIDVGDEYATDRPPEFPLEMFRRATSGWQRGNVGYRSGINLGFADESGTPTLEAFKDARAVGQPILPSGVVWAAHYLDEESGFTMRAVSQFQVMTALLTLRWDVLCG